MQHCPGLDRSAGVRILFRKAAALGGLRQNQAAKASVDFFRVESTLRIGRLGAHPPLKWRNIVTGIVTDYEVILGVEIYVEFGMTVKAVSQTQKSALFVRVLLLILWVLHKLVVEAAVNLGLTLRTDVILEF